MCPDEEENSSSTNRKRFGRRSISDDGSETAESLGSDSDQIFVQCYLVLRRAILFDKVIVIRQLGKILIDKITQLFKLQL